MKKLLALVLALVMTLGLATVGANAASVKYADASDITYKEAVDVMSEIGVLGGDENGFRPADTLKRSEGAKIIAYLTLGNKAAEALSGTGAKFTDVPANHWAAGYIEYLAAAGIIGGVGGGKFDPDGTLTTTAFAKMLLCTLGYDQALEGFVGSDWAINVQKVANSLVLFDGNDDVVGSAAIKREEAALYALNTLMTPLVEYDSKGNNITVGDTTISFGASNATPHTNIATNKVGRYRNIFDNDANATGGAVAQIVEFAEEYYPKLVLVDNGNSEDTFGRPAHKWTYDGKDVGTYKISEDLLYTNTVTLGTIYKDLGLTKATYVTSDNTNLASGTSAEQFYINGKLNSNAANQEYTTTGTTWDVQITKDSAYEIGGPGAEIYVYYDEGFVTICEIDWYVGDVTGVYAATASKPATIDITPRNGGVTLSKETTDFALDDVVLYTVKDGATGAQSVQKAETVSGVVSNFTGNADDGGSVTVDGTKYAYSKKIANAASSAILNNKITAEVVLDKYGYAIDIDDEIILNYGVVIDTGINVGSLGRSNAVQLLLTDGSKTAVVTLDGDYHDNNGTVPTYDLNTAAKGDGTDPMAYGDIVSFTVNSSGNYHLTKCMAAGTTTLSANDEEVISNNAGTILFGSGAARRVDGKTVFLIRDSSKNYKAYTGSKNVPTVIVDAGEVVTATSYAKTGSAAATLVFIYAENNKAVVKSDENIFVAVKKTIDETKDASIGNYYEYPVYLNGAPQYLKINSTQGAALNAMVGTTGTYAMYNSVSYNADNVATLGNRIEAVTGTKRESNDVVRIHGTSYSSDANTKVFYINENNEINSSSVKGLPNDDSTIVWFDTNSSNVLTYVYWMKAPTALSTSITPLSPASVANINAINTALAAGDALGIPSTVTVNGDLNWTAMTAGLTIAVGKGDSLIINGDVTFDDNAATNAVDVLTVDENGSVTVNARKASVFAAPFAAAVAGDLNLNNGRITVTKGTITTAGVINIDADDAAGDAHVDVNGTMFTLDPSNPSVIAGASLYVLGGSVEFGGPVNVTGTLKVSKGEMVVTGKLTASGTADIDITGGTVTLAAVEINNTADFDIANATVKMTTLTNNSTATVDVTGTAVVTANTVAGTGAVNATDSTATMTASTITNANATGVEVTDASSNITLTIAAVTDLGTAGQAAASFPDVAADASAFADLDAEVTAFKSLTGQATIDDGADPRANAAYAVAGDTVQLTIKVSIGTGAGEGEPALPTAVGNFALNSEDNATKKYKITGAEATSGGTNVTVTFTAE